MEQTDVADVGGKGSSWYTCARRLSHFIFASRRHRGFEAGYQGEGRGFLLLSSSKSMRKFSQPHTSGSSFNLHLKALATRSTFIFVLSFIVHLHHAEKDNPFLNPNCFFSDLKIHVNIICGTLQPHTSQCYKQHPDLSLLLHSQLQIFLFFLYFVFHQGEVWVWTRVWDRVRFWT